MKRLQDKVAIVFGAGPNIGGTVAHFMAREGASVVVSDVNQIAADETVTVLRSRKLEASAVQGDASVEADVARVVDTAIARYGKLNIVFNMAGKVHWSPIAEMDCDEWKYAISSFPTAGMLTTKHAARAMKSTGERGSIIHLLSTAAHFGQPVGTAYCTAKAALLNFARAAAMELAADQIRVNTITPCAMEHQLWTKMRNEVAQGRFEKVRNRPQYSREQFFNSIPMGRFPRAADLAWAAVFLASDEACFITGADLPVDGGLRFKYPSWQASEGATYEDYVANLERTAYGEVVGPLFDHDGQK